MSLIPTTISDGTANHSISPRGPVPSKNSVKTEYFEPGAKLLVQTEYSVTPVNQSLQRNVVRVSDQLAVDAAGTLRPAIVNISIAHDKRHAEADLAKLVTKAINTLPDAAARLSFVQRLP